MLSHFFKIIFLPLTNFKVGGFFMFKNEEKIELLLSISKKLDTLILLTKSKKLKSLDKGGDK